MDRLIRSIFLSFLLLLFFTVQVSAQTPWWRLNGFQSKVVALSPDKETDLQIPILIGIAPRSFKNTYGAVYSSGSVHQGVDIFAPRGAYIVSPTKAVVTRIDTSGAGGIAVYTQNPGNETFYYAHMTAVGPTIELGTEIEPGDLIGYVGNTGDAEGSSPHLHFQIFSLIGPIDPYPRLTKQFSDDDRIAALGKIIDRSDNPSLAGKAIAALYKSYLSTLPAGHTPFPKEITAALDGTMNAVAGAVVTTKPAQSSPVPVSTNAGTTISQNLSIGMKGDEVKKLQQYLIDTKTGQYADILKGYGPTGTFGRLTQAALIEFQKSTDSIPGTGFCGPLTRSYIAAHS